MTELWSLLENALGLDLDSQELSIWQMALRAALVYVIALAIIRVGDKRFLGENTAFDVILAVIFGSIVSRAITGQSAFFPTLAAAIVVVVVHSLMAVAAFHSDRFSYLVKGRSRVLVKDGEIDWKAMRRSEIGENDLMVALRTNGNVTSLDEVREARLERNGDISIIKQD